MPNGFLNRHQQPRSVNESPRLFDGRKHVVVIVAQHEFLLKMAPISEKVEKFTTVVNVPQLGEQGERDGGQPKHVGNNRVQRRHHQDGHHHFGEVENHHQGNENHDDGDPDAAKGVQNGTFAIVVRMAPVGHDAKVSRQHPPRMQSVFQRQSASPANFDVIGFLPNHFATR